MNANTIAGKIKQMTGRTKVEQATKDNVNVSQAIEGKKEEIVGLAQEKYGYVKDKAQQVVDNISTKSNEVKDQVDTRLNEYNSKLAAAADKLPGDMNQTVVRYPWMTVVSVFILGLALGFLLKPCFKKYEYKYQYPSEYSAS